MCNRGITHTFSLLCFSKARKTLTANSRQTFPHLALYRLHASNSTADEGTEWPQMVPFPGHTPLKRKASQHLGKTEVNRRKGGLSPTVSTSRTVKLQEHCFWDFAWTVGRVKGKRNLSFGKKNSFNKLFNICIKYFLPIMLFTRCWDCKDRIPSENSIFFYLMDK